MKYKTNASNEVYEDEDILQLKSIHKYVKHSLAIFIKAVLIFLIYFLNINMSVSNLK